jgi:hypothetical protein
MDLLRNFGASAAIYINENPAFLGNCELFQLASVLPYPLADPNTSPSILLVFALVFRKTIWRFSARGHSLPAF